MRIARPCRTRRSPRAQWRGRASRRPESRDAVAAERARPEKFGSGVEVGRIFEHNGRVADHRTQDAFDETFGDGRDVLHEVLVP